MLSAVWSLSSPWPAQIWSLWTAGSKILPGLAPPNGRVLERLPPRWRNTRSGNFDADLFSHLYFSWDNSDRCWQSKIKLGMMPFGAAEIGVCKAWVCLLWISVQVMFVEGGKSNVDKIDSGKRNPKVACVKSHKFQWRVIWNLSSKKITSPGKKLSVGNFGT